MTHRLGTGTGFGCKYRELVSEVRQGAVLNLSAAHAQNSRLPGARGLSVSKALTSGVNSLSLLPSF